MKATARKHFLFYSLYAWGLSFILIVLLVLMNSFSNSNSWYHPNIGKRMCWINGMIQRFFYFHLPITLTIVLNLILFAITAFRIKNIQKDTDMLHSEQFKKHNKEEQMRFKWCITLALAMGVNWSLEIMSFVFDWQVSSVPKWAWFVTDLCNTLYGVIIFFIFAFKKKILIAAKNRCTSCKPEKKPKKNPCQLAESAI